MRSKDENLLQRIAEYIQNVQVEEGRSPGQREITAKLKLNGRKTNSYVHELKRQGRIELNRDGTIRVPSNLDTSSANQWPLIGAVKCGSPTIAMEEFEGMFRLPQEFTGTGDFFLLKAEGDSMIDAGIIEGDYLVIRRQEDANQRDIVVACKESEYGIEESDATLKRYMMKNGRYVLQAENEKANYEDLDAEAYRIIGRLVGFYRRL